MCCIMYCVNIIGGGLLVLPMVGIIQIDTWSRRTTTMNYCSKHVILVTSLTVVHIYTLFLCKNICSSVWLLKGCDVAQVVEHSAVEVWILLHGESILHGRCICSLGYFPFQPVVHDWSMKSCGLCCPVFGKVHIKDLLLLIRKSSLYGNIGFPLKKCVTISDDLKINVLQRCH